MKRITNGLDRFDTHKTRILIAAWMGAFMLYGGISTLVDLLQ